MTFTNAINWLRRDPGHVENIGITNTSGTTFTVNAADGSAFSTSNFGFITLQSLANPGRLITYRITANQSFTQAQLGNNLFSITTGVNVAVDMPFFLYAVSNANNGENAIAFMISRVPNRTISPTAGNIGQNGNTNSTTQGSFFSLNAITASDYAAAPCLCIGSFRMQYSGGSTNWTIQTLNNSDGIGEFQDKKEFSFPPGQFGSNTSNYFTTANAPTFASANHNYRIGKDGTLYGYMTFANSTNGTDANNLTLVTAMVVLNQSLSYGFSIVSGTYSSLSLTVSPSPSQLGTLPFTNNGGTGLLLNNSLTNGSVINGAYTFIISIS